MLHLELIVELDCDRALRNLKLFELLLQPPNF